MSAPCLLWSALPSIWSGSLCATGPQPNRPAASAGESTWDNWASTAGTDQRCTALKSLNSSMNKNGSVWTYRNQKGVGIYLNQEAISKMQSDPWLVATVHEVVLRDATSPHRFQPSEMLHKCHMSSWNFERQSFHSFNLKIFIFLLCYRHWSRVLYNLWINLSNNHLIN